MKRWWFMVVSALVVGGFYLLLRGIGSTSPLALDAEEKAALKTYEGVSLSIIDEDQKTDTGRFAYRLTQLLDLTIVVEDGLAAVDFPLIITDRPSDYEGEGLVPVPLKKSKLSLYKPLESDEFEHSTMGYGVLRSDAQAVEDLFLSDAMMVYDELAVMAEAARKGEIKGYYYPGDQNLMILDDQLYVNELMLNTMTDSLALMVPEDLLEPFLKAVVYLDRSGDLGNMIIAGGGTEEANQLSILLTDEEKQWLKSRQGEALHVGVTNEAPLALQKEQQLFGPVIGVLKEMDRYLDVEFRFITGERDRLLETGDDHNTAFLFNEVPYEGLPQSDTLLSSPYVVAGLIDSGSLESESQLAGVALGVLDSHQPQLSIVFGPVHRVTAFDTYESMVKALEDGQLNYVVLPQIHYDYYNTKTDRTKLFKTLTLKERIDYRLSMLHEDPILLSIINKTLMVVNTEQTAETSLKGMPVQGRRDLSWLYALLIFIGINGVFFGGYFIRYMLNKQENSRLTFLFTNDQLTHLPNKYGLTPRVDQLIGQGSEGQCLYIKLDDYRDIVDRQGMTIGHQVILEFGQKLMGLLDNTVLLGRVAEDVYCLVVSEGADMTDRVRMISDQFRKDQPGLNRFDVSIAVVRFPEHGDSYEQLHKYGEHTLEHMRINDGPGSTRLFTEDIYKAYLNEKIMAEEIRVGLKNEEFLLFIQPQVLLPEERIIGGEVLVRWIHPEKGFQSPGAFLPVAERNGLMGALDMYMMDKSMKILQEIQSTYPKMKMSVNVTPGTFLDVDYLQMLEDLQKERGIDLSWITIEVTEDSGFDDFQRAQSRFDEIQAMGFKIALDDFGKGYSSLAYVEKLSFDVLKIDKVFIDNIHLNEDSKKIYHLITDLADIKGISVVAEGVEYLEQLKILMERSGTIAQGYYYSKPIPAEDFLVKFREQ